MQLPPQMPWVVSAEEEYKRQSKIKPEDVATLRKWMTTQPHLPCIDDEMLIQFLFACYFNVDAAKTTIENYYTYKTTMPEFFSNLDPLGDEMQTIVNETMIAAPLREPDAHGNRMMVCRLRSTDISKYSFNACVKWLLMTSAQSLFNRGVQQGYMIIYDAAGYTMSHALRNPLSGIKNYVNYGKNGSPIRVTGIHFINSSSVVKKVMTLVRPFLNEHIRNMIKFHTSPESFFKDIAKENIPLEYGGEGPSMEILHNENVERVTKLREWFKIDETLRADDSKRIGKSKKSNTISVEQSFSKLEID